MATLSDVRRAAKKLGASVDDTRVNGYHTCEVMCGPGLRWKGSDVHAFVDTSYSPAGPDYADLLQRMSYGCEPCPDADCDWCREEAA